MLYLFGAKKMQTSAKKACFQFAECCFSSAKIRLFLVTSKAFGKNVGMMINRVGGKRSSFSPTFVFRPLTPPYMRFRIRRFLFWVPFEV